MIARLHLATLYLSERCNSRCVSCDYWRHGTGDMSLGDVHEMLPAFATLGTTDILISGGEPLLNPQWHEIAALLKDNGFNLWLLTSGLSLAKHASAVSRLFDSVTVSLDGAQRETYATIRGVDAFDKVCDGIRAVAAAGTPTGLRVTLQKRNYRELPDFVKLAHELGVDQVSFLAVDVNNSHAFARREGLSPRLDLSKEDIGVFETLIRELETERADDFESGFIAESPARFRGIRDYFLGLQGLGDFPPVRCNAPEFSAVIGADGRVSPCFFIPGPADVPRAPDLKHALDDDSMRELRAAIRAGKRPECEKCVCSMWRDTRELAVQDGFKLRVAGND